MAALTALLAAACFFICVAGSFGIWIANGWATERLTLIFARVAGTLDAANQGLDQVKASLDRAGTRLAATREEQRKLAQDPQNNNTMHRWVARTVQQRVVPELGDANEKLHKVAELAVVVNSILEDVGTFPAFAASGLDLERLAEVNSQLAGVGSATWELSRLLADSNDKYDPDRVGDQLSRVQQIAAYEPQLVRVRDTRATLEAKTFKWLDIVSVIVSISCVWIALSQISMFFHACTWWRRSGDDAGSTY
ncbi:MAG: hypothetical protein AB7K24_01850 [Gemmataceae bacterium]